MNRPFTPFDIIWVKNITNAAVGHAYMNLPTDTFFLHFPTSHRTNAASPNVNEIILLYQKINGENVFTHLVTPIDEVVYEDNYRPDYRFGRNVRIIANTPLSNLIPVASTLWDEVNFRGISQGNACKIENITGIGIYDTLLENTWEIFSPFFRASQGISLVETNSLNHEIDVVDPEMSVIEGRLRLIAHLGRERNRQIVATKKQQALANGGLECEVCRFSFDEKYGVDFIECHHLTPIAEPGIRVTTLDDLALVCSNCHRMLHKRIDRQFLSISELQERIRSIALLNS